MSNLSASQEDYLELICNSLEANDSVKAVELARKLNVSRASVSEALSKLADKNLIVYEGHKGISITPQGLKKAQEVIQKHNTLTSFFENVLGLNSEISEETACKIEHVISNEVFLKFQDFEKYCSQESEFINRFKEKYKQWIIYKS